MDSADAEERPPVNVDVETAESVDDYAEDGGDDTDRSASSEPTNQGRSSIVSDGGCIGAHLDVETAEPVDDYAEDGGDDTGRSVSTEPTNQGRSSITNDGRIGGHLDVGKSVRVDNYVKDVGDDTDHFASTEGTNPGRSSTAKDGICIGVHVDVETTEPVENNVEDGGDDTGHSASTEPKNRGRSSTASDDSCIGVYLDVEIAEPVDDYAKAGGHDTDQSVSTEPANPGRSSMSSDGCVGVVQVHDAGPPHGEDDDGEDDDGSADGTVERPPTKARRSLGSGHSIGAVQVDQQAPRLNRRFYLGLDRASARARRGRERARRRPQRQDAFDDPDELFGDADGGGGGGEAQIPPRRSMLESTNSGSAGLLDGVSAMIARMRTSSREILISATLVEDEGEVVEAEQVGFLAQKWKTLACGISVLLGLLLVLVSLFVVYYCYRTDSEVVTSFAMDTVPSALPSSPPSTWTPSTSPSYLPSTRPSSLPSAWPSSPPTFDRRPTFEVVRERGHVRCGLASLRIESGEGFYVDLCRSVAAVIFGDAESFVGVAVTNKNRFRVLNGRSADLLIYGDTYTVEREVREPTTKAGFAFSSPIDYGAMSYFGKRNFVECAEERRRYKECSSLRICVVRYASYYNIVAKRFPSDFLEVLQSWWGIIPMVWNGTCNVAALERPIAYASNQSWIDAGFVQGPKIMSTEPHSIVTRKDDPEFSDIINWVVQALVYGEQKGFTKDPSRCQTNTSLTLRASDLNFLNAPFCVGNYAEIRNRTDRSLNRINDGTTGMIYAAPFGELSPEDDDIKEIDASFGDTLLDGMRNEGSLNCGLVVPDRFVGGSVSGDKLLNMNEDFCRTLAAAIFNGDHEAVTVTHYLEEGDAFVALNNGIIDVVSGARAERKYDFQSSPLHGGFHFSTAFYYGNETSRDDMSFFSLATRDEDLLFSSFANCVVMATIHAQENGITRERSGEMPLITIFGSKFSWALRDAITYSGNYDEIYSKHFGHVWEGENRGRNILNNEGGPQMHSFPGLIH